MSDLRSALEARWREFEPPPDGLSRLHGLRRADAAHRFASKGGSMMPTRTSARDGSFRATPSVLSSGIVNRATMRSPSSAAARSVTRVGM